MVTKSLKRRAFLAHAGGGAALAAATFPAPALAKGKRRLKMVTTWPKNFPGLGTSAERLAQRISEISGGEITVKVYAGGELVPPFESFDAVAGGVADMYHGAEYYWQGKSTAYNFFTAMPFGFTAPEINAWIYHGGGQALWDELAAKFNIKPMMAGNTSVQMGGWFRTEINSLEDFKGLKIRMPGLGGEVVRRLGAAAVSTPAAEIFPALQSGAIDAAEWIGPWNDMAFGFYKIAKYYYTPGFQEPGSSLALGFNLEVWNSLSKAQQSLIETCAGAENDVMLAEFNARNALALKTLVERHGVLIRHFSDEIYLRIGELSDQVAREIAEENPLNKRIYESYSAARKQYLTWFDMADRAIWEIRQLPFEYG